MKKILTFGIIVLCLGLILFFGCNKQQDKQQTDQSQSHQEWTLKSGYIPILDCTPIIVAYEKGFFKEEGINAEKPVLIRTWPALMEAFTSKKIDLTHILLPQVIIMKYDQGVNLRSVAFNHTDVVAMMVANKYNSLCDLGGKVVGCPTWWAPHTGIFEDVLRKAGLTPVVGKSENELKKNEVCFRIIPPPDMVEALKSGTIAGCCVSEPFGAAGEILAGTKLLKMSGDVWKDHPCCQSVMLADFINEDRDRAQRITNAIYKAILWAHNNREALAQMLGKEGGGYFPMPVKVLEKALLSEDIGTYGEKGTGAIMHASWNVERVGFKPYPYPEAFVTNMKMMKAMVVDSAASLSEKLKNLDPELVAKDIVDYDLANKAYQLVGGDKAFGIQSKQSDQVYEVLLNKQNNCNPIK
jgi:NitT/TauT family transport system substrate-binding protein